MFLKVKPTAEIKKETRGRGEKQRQVEVQVCDLFIPGERNPRDFAHVVESASDQLDPKKVYYIAGESFGVNQYGSPELRPYWNLQFIEEASVIAHFVDLQKSARAA